MPYIMYTKAMKATDWLALGQSSQNCCKYKVQE
jgi:hypothetical protein